MRLLVERHTVLLRNSWDGLPDNLGSLRLFRLLRILHRERWDHDLKKNSWKFSLNKNLILTWRVQYKRNVILGCNYQRIFLLRSTIVKELVVPLLGFGKPLMVGFSFFKCSIDEHLVEQICRHINWNKNIIQNYFKYGPVQCAVTAPLAGLLTCKETAD